MSLHEERASAKEVLVREAEALARAVDIRNGHAQAQDQMRRWKAVGHSGPHENRLWDRFKGAHDALYARMRARPAKPPRQPGPYDGHPSSELVSWKRGYERSLREIEKEKRAYERLNKGTSFWNNEGYKEIEQKARQVWDAMFAIEQELTRRRSARR
jgi:hypothetical protein